MLKRTLEHPPCTPTYLVAGRPIGAAPVTVGSAGLLHAQVVEVGLKPGNTQRKQIRAQRNKLGHIEQRVTIQLNATVERNCYPRMCRGGSRY